MDKKLEQIQERIDKFKANNPPTYDNSKKRKEVDALGIGLDLVAGTGVGITIGIFLDKYFASKPLCIIIFSLIGVLAGFKMIWQKVNKK
ncbi:MAG: AtpZ/AtpI family protein [Rickettsia endosymbiont of Bryobia graminum]|nr:AtpZ/AtpI family protein [Rickettsia endosymbiont of Bryobia graminum]